MKRVNQEALDVLFAKQGKYHEKLRRVNKKIENIKTAHDLLTTEDYFYYSLEKDDKYNINTLTCEISMFMSKNGNLKYLGYKKDDCKTYFDFLCDDGWEEFLNQPYVLKALFEKFQRKDIDDEDDIEHYQFRWEFDVEFYQNYHLQQFNEINNSDEEFLKFFGPKEFQIVVPEKMDIKFIVPNPNVYILHNTENYKWNFETNQYKNIKILDCKNKFPHVDDFIIYTYKKML